MTKRIECRQVETLLEKRAAQDAIETARRSQYALDDWHRGRNKQKATARNTSPKMELFRASDF